MSFGLVQQALVIGDLQRNLAVFFLDLEPFQGGQAAQLHVEDGRGLGLAEAEAGHQVVAGVVGAVGGADGGDDGVDIAQGDEVTFQDVLPLLGLVQVELGAAGDDVEPVVDVDLQGALERQQPRLLVHQGQQLHAEGRLQRGVLEQLVEHLARLGVALQFDDDGDAVAVGRVADVADVGDDALGDQLGHALDEQRLVDLEGQLGDVDLHPLGVGPRNRLDLGHAAHDHPAAAGGVGAADAFGAQDDAGGGEVGAFDELHQLVEGDVVDVVLPVDEEDERVANFVQVVRRDVGGHAHGDARRAVEQQVGQAGGQHIGLHEGVVEVGHPVDGVLVDVLQHFHGDGGHAGFGVTHGGRAVAVDAAEVALAVDQRVAHGELLGHAHHGVIDSAVAVGVIFTQHFADETGALAMRRIRPQAHVVHGIEDAPVDRLEAVAGVGQGAGDDDAHGVIQVGVTHLLVDVNV